MANGNVLKTIQISNRIALVICFSDSKSRVSIDFDQCAIPAPTVAYTTPIRLPFLVNKTFMNYSVTELTHFTES